MLVYRRPARGLLYINRLFKIPGLQPGIPGLTLDHFLFDSMHTIELGILAYLFGRVLWDLVAGGYFGTFTVDDYDEVNTGMEEHLKNWYKTNEIPWPERLPTITVSMLGPKDAPLCKIKAGKAKSLLPWIVELLANSGGKELLNQGPLGREGTMLLRCAQGISEFFAVLKREPRRLPEHAFPQLDAATKKAVDGWEKSGNGGAMKWHVFAQHLVDQMKFAGNCTWTHNYSDESENFSTRKRGNFLYRPQFTDIFLSKWILREVLPHAP